MDCPNDAVENRMHTLEIRLLCGDTAARRHAHVACQDPVHSAALQLVNVLFSVPQISGSSRPDTARTCGDVALRLGFWREHRDLLWTAPWNRCTPRRSTPLCSRAWVEAGHNRSVRKRGRYARRRDSLNATCHKRYTRAGCRTLRHGGRRPRGIGCGIAGDALRVRTTSSSRLGCTRSTSLLPGWLC